MAAIVAGTPCTLDGDSSCTSMCPSGYYAINAAFQQTAGVDGFALLESYPMGPSMWFVDIDAIGAEDYEGTMTAVCLLA